MTFDELVTIDRAGLYDAEFSLRLHATNRVPRLKRVSSATRSWNAGISPQSFAGMPRIDQAEKSRVLANSDPTAQPR